MPSLFIQLHYNMCSEKHNYILCSAVEIQKAPADINIILKKEICCYGPLFWVFNTRHVHRFL